MYGNIRFIICILMILSLFKPVFAADAPDAVQGEVPTGVLVGQFKKNAKTPLSNGRLFIYNKAMGPPSADRYVRVPDQLGELDNSGRFELQLPAGIYYLSAVNAPAGMPMGPPPVGEPVYYKMNTKKEIQPFTVLAGKKTNAGVISSSLPHKRGSIGKLDSIVTSIAGTVVDENGAPVEGAVILAHLKAGVQEMASYVSERTEKDGSFLLQVNDGGNYYLRVRSEYHGGAPNPGDIVNYNDPAGQLGVSLKKGEKLTGITIKANRQREKGPLSSAK